MAIANIQNINIGLPNESVGSDSLYTAFQKVNNNFATLFSCASPYCTFVGSTGIAASANSTTNIVTITNTGVTQLNAGTGITLSGTTGNITISSTGGGGGSGVTSVGLAPVNNTRLSVTGSPIVSSGIMTVDLVATGITPGTYINPSVTVDAYGRVIDASSGTTFDSLTITGGTGISVVDNSVSGIYQFTVTNTGVTSLIAGSGISLSGSNGAVTVSSNNASNANYATYSGTAFSVDAGNINGTVNLANYAAVANTVSGANVSGAVAYATTANGVAGANVSGAVAYATTANGVAGANVTGQVSFANVANHVAAANVSGLGNIATINLDGSSSNVLYGNGVFAAVGGGGGGSNISNGNSNVNIPAANGNVNISAVGNANVLIVRGPGVNVAGTFGVTGNANAGNIGAATGVFSTAANTGLIQNGTSNITIAASGNINVAVGGNRLIVTSNAANINGNFNVTGNIYPATGINFGNVAGGGGFINGSLSSGITLYSALGANINYNSISGLVANSNGVAITATNSNVSVTMNNKSVTNMSAVTYSSVIGAFIAVGTGNDAFPYSAQSTDGKTWTTPAIINNTPNMTSMNSVVVSSGGLAVAIGGTNGKPVYSTSYFSGTTFTEPAAMNGSAATSTMTSVTINSAGLFVAVGFNGSGYPLYATSADGSTWTTPATMNGSATVAYMQAVTVNSSGKFVAVGYNVNGYAVYATSADGSTWTTPATMNSTTNSSYMRAVTVNSSGLFVAVGFSNQFSVQNFVYATSADGSTWTTPAVVSSPYYAEMWGVAVNSSGLFVAVGFDNGSGPHQYRPLYATSADGTTWSTPATMNGSNASATMYGIAVNSSGLFVATGTSPGSSPPEYAVYATSTNGSNWTTPNVLAAPAMTSINTGNTSTGWNFYTTGVASSPILSVSSLPTAIAGLKAFVNDSNVAASGNIGAIVHGGGSNVAPVWSDGTNWYIG